MLKEREAEKVSRSMQCSKDSNSGLTIRVVVLGVIYIVIACILEVYISNGLLPAEARISSLALIAVVALISAVIHGRKVERRFSTKELVTVGVLFGVGATTVVFFMGLLYTLRGPLLSPIVRRFLPLAKYPFVPGNLESGRMLTVGGAKVPWSAWVVPVIIWLSFFYCLAFVSQCIAVIVRRRWSEIDHLTFPVLKPVYPIVQYGKTQEGRPILRDYVFWVGVVISMTYSVFTVLSKYYPALPSINTDALGGPIRDAYLGHPVIGPALWGQHSIAFLLRVSLGAFGCGIAWFVNLNVIFSVWFFYLFKYVVSIIISYMGLYGYKDLPMMQTQGIVGVSCMGLLLLLDMKSQLKEMYVASFGKTANKLLDEHEPFSYRTAIIGSIAGIIVLTGFLWLALDVFPLYGFLCIALFLLLGISLARFQAEAGVGMSANMLVRDEMSRFFGSDLMTLNNAGGLAFLGGLYWQGVPVNISNSIVNWKLGQTQNASMKSITKAMWIAVGVATIGGVAIMLPLSFQAGLGQQWSPEYIYGSGMWDRIVGALRSPREFGLMKWIVGALVIVFMAFLSMMTKRFIWWPFHPIGFAISSLDTAWVFAFPFFITWIIKSFTFRWGGRALYDRLTPFFIGLFLGEALISVVSGVIGIVRCIA